MRILFCGTAEFALPTLGHLVKSEHDIVGVITQPDRPRGRGKKLASPPVKELASEYNLPVYQPVTSQELIDIIVKYELNPELIVVVAYGMLLPAKLLNLPAMGSINLHPSLLPKYRGAAPIQRAIMNGEQITGITSMYLSEELDAGDIILQEQEEVIPNSSAGEMAEILAESGAGLMLRTLTMIEKGTAPRHTQDGSCASYAPPLSKKDELIDWNQDAYRIYNQIRGMNPKPGAHTVLKGKILKVWSSKVIKDELSEFSPGEVVEIDAKTGFSVQTGEGQLLLTEVQPAGKARMSAAAYLRGNKILQGLSLG